MQPKTTHWWKLSEYHSVSELKKNEQLLVAAQLLKEGGLVAFPTETVYGLGADGTSSKAVKRIFQAKGRPSDNPLIVHFGSKEQIGDWVKEIPPDGQALLEAFVPGPLTLILPHNGKISPLVSAGLPTIGVRVPSHPVSQALLQLVDRPIAAPSANKSGRPSPTEARHVWNDLNGTIELILDGGATGVGVESTVVDVTGKRPVLLRPGGIPLEDLKKVVRSIRVDEGLLKGKKKPRSPGMKYRHYAPRAEMWLVTGGKKDVVSRINQLIREATNKGKKVGVLTTEENSESYVGASIVTMGYRHKPASVAQKLFHALRELDSLEVDVIYAETFPEKGIFASVMNRLQKAADGKIIKANPKK